MCIRDRIPEEMTIVLRGATKKSIYYDYGYETTIRGTDNPETMKEERRMVVDLDGKVLVILEEGESEELVKELKPILSHDTYEIKYKFVDRTAKGKHKTKTVHVRGFPAYIGISTRTVRDEELATREWLTSPIDDEAKFRAVVKSQAEEAMMPFLFTEENKDCEVVKNAIRLLRKLRRKRPVILLFAEDLMDMIPLKQPRIMRDFKKLLSLIKISAFLHQFSRPTIEIGGKDYIVAIRDDYEIGMKLAEFMFRGTFTGVPQYVQDFFEKVIMPLSNSGEEITYNSLATKFYEIYGRRISRRGLSRYLAPLLETGMVEKVSEGAGKPVKFNVLEDASEAGEPGRPTLEHIFTRTNLLKVLNKVGVPLEQKCIKENENFKNLSVKDIYKSFDENVLLFGTGGTPPLLRFLSRDEFKLISSEVRVQPLPDSEKVLNTESSLKESKNDENGEVERHGGENTPKDDLQDDEGEHRA